MTKIPSNARNCPSNHARLSPILWPPVFMDALAAWRPPPSPLFSSPALSSTLRSLSREAPQPPRVPLSLHSTATMLCRGLPGLLLLLRRLAPTTAELCQAAASLAIWWRRPLLYRCFGRRRMSLAVTTHTASASIMVNMARNALSVEVGSQPGSSIRRMRRAGRATAAGDARIHPNYSIRQVGLLAAVRRRQRRPLAGLHEQHVTLEPDGRRRLEANGQRMCA